MTGVQTCALPISIVAEIEAEQALVAANRELIERFEKKIQVILARVWGEDEPAVADRPESDSLRTLHEALKSDGRSSRA